MTDWAWGPRRARGRGEGCALRGPRLPLSSWPALWVLLCPEPGRCPGLPHALSLRRAPGPLCFWFPQAQSSEWCRETWGLPWCQTPAGAVPPRLGCGSPQSAKAHFHLVHLCHVLDQMQGRDGDEALEARTVPCGRQGPVKPGCPVLKTAGGSQLQTLDMASCAPNLAIYNGHRLKSSWQEAGAGQAPPARPSSRRWKPLALPPRALHQTTASHWLEYQAGGRTPKPGLPVLQN